MPYVGGIRSRLIYDSLYYMLEDALGDLGWFTEHPSRKPVTFRYEPVENEDQITTNTVALSDADMTDYPHEMGSNMGEQTWTMYVDFYAEDKAIGKHLINDVRDILLGRMPHIGREHPVLEVLDYTLATPVEVFYVEIDDVVIDKAMDFPDPYRRNWYTCRFSLVDHYGG